MPAGRALRQQWRDEARGNTPEAVAERRRIAAAAARLQDVELPAEFPGGITVENAAAVAAFIARRNREINDGAK